jgi:serine/threonine-protein kinase
MLENDPPALDREPGEPPEDSVPSAWASWDRLPDPFSETLGGRYQLQNEIGSGAFSITYRALDQRLGRQVAIKVLRPQYALDPTSMRRFEREARAAASVSHPNVVDVHDFGRQGNRLYIVMQYIEGENLKEHLVQGGPLPQREAVRIARQVLAGLAAIHRAGIIHRDVKPQNILIGRDGIARVADFGIAHVGADAGLTATGTTLGTASYMAPEQALGGHLVRATDLYAVGIVLYEMLTGRLPFEAPTAIATIYAHIHTSAVAPSHRVAGQHISPALDRIVMRAMAKRPEGRFADAEEMRRALTVTATPADDEVASTQAIKAKKGTLVTPTSWQRATPPWATKRPFREADALLQKRRWDHRAAWTLALVVLLLFGGGIMAAWVLSHDPGGEELDPRPTVQVAAEAPTAPVEALAATGGRDQRDTPFTARPSEVPTDTPVPTPSETPQPTPTPNPTDTPAPSPTDTPVATMPPTEILAPIVPIDPTAQSDGDTDNSSGDDAPLVMDPQDTAAGVDEKVGTTQPMEISFAASDWQGAYFQETGNLQPWSALYAQTTGYGQGSLTFSLEGEPASNTFVLMVEGMTSENWTALPIAIRINGQEVYAGTSPFPTWNGSDGQQPWTAIRFDLPTAPLQPGANTVTFVNGIGEAGFGLPPYILLAGGTLSVDLHPPGGAITVPVVEQWTTRTDGAGYSRGADAGQRPVS